MHSQNTQGYTSDSDSTSSSISSMGSPQIISTEDWQSQHLDGHRDTNSNDTDHDKDVSFEPSLAELLSGAHPKSAEDMTQAYNHVIASYIEHSNPKCGISTAEGLRDLIGSLTAMVLSEASKHRGGPKKAQERVLKDQKWALDHLVTIQRRSRTLASKEFELYEDPIPRLFIVLPKSLDTSNSSENEFRLYFLCECERDSPNSVSNCIHFAQHKGYDLSRPAADFFAMYDAYVLSVLELVKYGVVTEKMMASPLTTYKVLDGVGTMMEKQVDKDTIRRQLDNTIKYIQDLIQASQDDHAIAGDVTQGVDLQSLHEFISDPHPAQTLGDLYRTVSDDGHVKWICRNHYLQKYGSASTTELHSILHENNGQFDEQRGKIVVRCIYLATAVQLSNQLQAIRGVHELDFAFGWDASENDLQEICGALSKTNVSILRLDCSAFVYVEPPVEAPPPPAEEKKEGEEENKEDKPAEEPPAEAPPPPAEVPSVEPQGRFSPIVNLIDSVHLQEFSIDGCDWIIDGLTSPGTPPIQSLRKLRIGIKELGDPSKQRFLRLLERFPNLIRLSLYCNNWTDVYGVIHNHITSLSQLETLTLAILGQEEVVLHVKSQTVHSNSSEFRHVANIIGHRRDLSNVFMPFHLDKLASQIDTLDSIYGGQENLTVAFVDNGRTVAEVLFRDPNQSYSSTPTGQHFRGRRSEMYIRWIDRDALGLHGEDKSRTGALIDSTVQLNLNEVSNLLARLANEPRTSVEIICDHQPRDMMRLAISGMVTLSWTDLTSLNLDICENADQWIDELARTFTQDGTPSLQVLKVYAGPSRDCFKDLSSESARWIISMVSKSLETLKLRGIGLQDNDWEQLLNSINFSNLKLLDVAKCNINRDRIQNMLRAIPEGSPLGELKLHGIEWLRNFSKADQETFIAENCLHSKPYIVF